MRVQAITSLIYIKCWNSTKNLVQKLNEEKKTANRIKANAMPLHNCEWISLASAGVHTLRTLYLSLCVVSISLSRCGTEFIRISVLLSIPGLPLCVWLCCYGMATLKHRRNERMKASNLLEISLKCAQNWIARIIQELLCDVRVCRQFLVPFEWMAIFFLNGSLSVYVSCSICSCCQMLRQDLWKYAFQNDITLQKGRTTRRKASRNWAQYIAFVIAILNAVHNKEGLL